MVRNRPDLRFEGRIHEQILPAIRATGGDVAWTDMYVVHSGSDQCPAAQEVKRRRDLRLLELELADWPEHPFTLDDLRVEGLLIKSRTASKQGRWDDVRAALDQAVAERPGDLVTLRERCEFLFNHGTPEVEAASAWEQASRLAPNDLTARQELERLAQS